MRLQVRWVVAVVAALSVSFHAGAREDDHGLKRDAVSRVVDSHDPALSIGIGRVYVKQAALRASC